MPVTPEQAQEELQRRKDARDELARRRGLNTTIEPKGELQAFRRPEQLGVFDNPNKQLDALLGDGNLDDYMPFDVKYDFGRIIRQTESPADTEGKIKLSILYKSIADIGPRISFDMMDELNKITIGRGEPIKPSGAWKQIKDQYQSYLKELSEKGTLNIPKNLTPGSLPFAMSKHLAVLASEVVEDIHIPTIFQGIKEMIVPSTEQTKEEWKQQLKETPEKIAWMAAYVGTLGGRLVPRGVPRDLRQILLHRAEEYAGFGPALAPAGGDAAVLALEWGAIYPALFKAVGLTGKAIIEIPKIAKGSETIKRLGGLSVIVKRWPRAYARIANIIKAFAKGAGVGSFSSAIEDISQGMEADDILQHAKYRAVIMGGVASAFQIASEVDTVLYIRNLRNALVKSSNQRIDAKIREIDARPNTTAKRDAMKSLDSLKKIELQSIDKIVSAAEANLLRIKESKLYQTGQEAVENPQRVAERFIRYGLEKTLHRIPKGAEVLKKGLGATRPFIEMPMTKVAESIEIAKSIAHSVRHPIKAATQVASQSPVPKAPSVTPITPPPVKGKPAEKVEDPDEVEEREFRAELKEMDKEIKAAPTEAITAPQKPIEARIPAEVVETPDEKIARVKVESEIATEDAEIIKPNLYIGNVTGRMKRVFGEIFGVDPTEVKEFEEGGLPTKRTQIEVTKGQARQAAEALEEDIILQLDENRINTERQLALANAQWGNIVELRKALGETAGKRPFTVDRAGKRDMRVIINTKARIWQAIRGTAIDPANITIGELLGTTIRRMAQAARKAFAAGKEEVRELFRQRRIADRAKKQLKKRANKAIETINKNIPASVDFFYREAIQTLQESFTPKPISEKKLKQRTESIEFFKRFPERLKEIPASKWKKLLRKPLNDLTLAELEDIAENVKELIKQGKLKRILREKQHRQEIGAITEQLTEAIGKIPPSKIITVENAKVPITKKSLQKVKAWTWRPSRIFDMLDGVKNFMGKAHDIFVNQVNRATDAELRMVDKRKDAGLKKMRSLGISLNDLGQVRVVNGVRYSVDEMIGVYGLNKNRLGRLAIRYGNNLSDKDVEDVIAALSDKEKAWGDAIIENYAGRYEALRRAVITVENRDMGLEAFYMPIRRIAVDHPTMTDEVVEAVLQREGLRRVYAQHGFTITRKEVPKELQKPVNLSATNVWLTQINRQEHYIHFAELIRDLRRIADNKEFRSAIENNFGKEFVKTIDHYIDIVANPTAYKSYNALENLSRKLRQNAVIAYLAYNLVTMAKQLPSLALYLPEAGTANLFSSAMQFALNPKTMTAMVKEKDPQVAHRSIERELEELKRQNFELHQNLLAKFGRAGLEGIYLFDSVVRTIGWNAVYQKAFLRMGEAEAVQQAQNVTLRTQPAAASKDLARLYTTNEFANWFTMFTNQLNQIFNIATYDMSGYLKNEKYQEFAMTSFALGLMALLIWIITHRRMPRNEKELADAVAEQALNTVPLVGKSIMAGKQGWGDTGLPAFEAPKAVGKSIDKIIKGEFNEEDVKDYIEGIAVLFGVPYTGIKRVIKVADKGELKELVGGKPKK